MSSAAAGGGAKPDTKLDARILQLILKGQLKDSSSIADSESGESVLLADHPHFSKVLHLARVNRSLGILKNVSWWTSREPEWSATVANRPVNQILFDTSRQHSTGFMTISDGERAKVVAFSAGLTVCIGSNLKRDQLSEVIVEDEAVERGAMDDALAHAESNQRTLEWALLDKGLLEVDDLLGYYELQAHHRLFDLFDWRSGELGFHLDDRAAQLENVVNLPLMALLRKGMWMRRQLSETRLRSLCEPLIDQPAPLRVLQSLGTLQFGLSENEAIVIGGAKNHAHAKDLLVDLERMGEGSIGEGLRFLYLFTQLGVIGVEGPEHAQPILEDITDEQDDTPDFGPMGLPDLGLFDDVQAAPAGQKRKRRMTGPTGAQAEKRAPRMTGSTQIKEYRLQLQLENEGRRLLNAGQFAEAVGKFKQLTERQDRPIQALAYQAVAALLSGTPEGRANCVDYARRALELDHESALAHSAMARVLEAGDLKASERHEKRALALSQYNDSWFLEVKGLLRAGGRRDKGPKDRSPALIAMSFTVLLLGGLFFAANIMEMGTKEYFYSGDDLFFYIRRGSLLLLGLIGLMAVTGAGPIRIWRELGFKTEIKFAVLALIWGGFVGFLSPPQRVDGQVAVVVGLTVFHVIAEEVFFRGFVTRALLDKFGDWQQAVPLSALIYAVYHLTYYSFWAESALVPKFYWCAVIALFAGFPYAGLYVRTKGILTPMICHGAVSLTMMTVSLLR